MNHKYTCCIYIYTQQAERRNKKKWRKRRLALISLTNDGILGRIAQGERDVNINRWVSTVKEEIFSN